MLHWPVSDFHLPVSVANSNVLTVTKWCTSHYYADVSKCLTISLRLDGILKPLHRAVVVLNHLHSKRQDLSAAKAKLLQCSTGLQQALKHLLQQQAQSEVRYVARVLMSTFDVNFLLYCSS